MPYAAKLCIYMFAAAALAFFTGRWLRSLRLAVNLLSASVFTYLTIIIGRRFFGRTRIRPEQRNLIDREIAKASVKIRWALFRVIQGGRKQRYVAR